ncbi:hypothetical protein [Nonomuraea sediminis]|nr:hypothetical protein [Nonomuraea sediminis]
MINHPIYLLDQASSAEQPGACTPASCDSVPCAMEIEAAWARMSEAHR